MPKISVIVPVYNVENKLPKCIESLICQTFTDFEVILIDDGSVDKSGTICDEYAGKDKRIKVIHKANGGVSATRNVGLDSAKGEYIAFVDSDDYVEREYLEELYDLIRRHNADISMCNYYSVTESEKKKMSHGFGQDTFFDRTQIEEVVYHNIFSNESTVGYFSLWNKLFRKGIIDENGILCDTGMSFGEDMIFILHYLKYANSICFSEKALYSYEQSQNGLFSSYRASFLGDIMRCYEAIIDQTKPAYCDDNAHIPLSIKYFWYIRRYENGIIENERNKIGKLYEVFKNRSVNKIFKTLVMASDEQKKLYSIDDYDLRVPKLVLRKKLFLAASYAIYQLDDKLLIKKMRIKIGIVLSLTRQRGGV